MAKLSWIDLSSGDTATWAAIQQLYSRLNTISTTHAQGTVTVPSKADGGDLIEATDITRINNKIINSLRPETHLKSATYTAVANPTVGTLIDPNLIERIQTNLDNMWGICHHTPKSNNSNCGDRGDFGTGGFGEAYG